MLLRMDSAFSRSKVAEPASAKSSSSPTSPDMSDWVPVNESSSSSFSWSSSSALSSSSLPRMAVRVSASSLAGRGLRVVFRGGVAALNAGLVAGLAGAALRGAAFFDALFGAAVFLPVPPRAPEGAFFDEAFREVAFLADVFFEEEALRELFFGEDFLAAGFFALEARRELLALDFFADVFWERDEFGFRPDVFFLAALMGRAR
jgi:hypothetical protein